MKSLAAFSLAALLTTPAVAKQPPPLHSLFFTPDESEKIEALVTKSSGNSTDTSSIHLGAVLFYGPDDWAVWLQNKMWVPGTESADLHITDVAPDKVYLIWTPASGAAAHAINLQPYQTYQTTTGRIVEGAP